MNGRWSGRAWSVSMPRRRAILVLLLLLAGRAFAETPARTVGPVPEALRKALNLADFYQQYVDAGGIAILGSAKVSRAAMLEAAYLVDQVLQGRDDLRKAMADAKVRITVMAATEFTTDVPEHAHLKPAEHWNLRARGLGGTRQCPCTSCGEENVLELDGDPYRGENILIHEFAHTIHGVGLKAADPAFDGRLREVYDSAMKAGLWKGTYAATSAGEYWAEGVQGWFDCNQSKNFIHNGVRTREGIREYDPALAKLLADVFGDNPWRYTSPRKSKERTYLADVDWSRMPKFAWPEHLLQWKKQEAERRNRPSGP